jgi:hypothetical protein
MATIAEILGWKFNHAPGIRTKDGVLTAFPEAVGPMPTETEMNTYRAEYLEFLRAEINDTPIKEQLAANDLRAIRAILEGDTARIDAIKIEQSALRARLISNDKQGVK